MAQDDRDRGKLAGRVALVTGAGSGIGRAIATLFAAEGARVVVNDVTLAAAQRTVDELAVSGADAYAVAADVSSSAQVGAMVADVGSRLGSLDVLVNNAGISEGEPGEQDRLNTQAEAVLADMMTGQPRAVHWDIASQVTDESWDRMIGVHLSGHLLLLPSGHPADDPGRRRARSSTCRASAPSSASPVSPTTRRPRPASSV